MKKINQTAKKTIEALIDLMVEDHIKFKNPPYMPLSLERLGQDETMADIAKRFNGKRVRKRTPPIAPVPRSSKR